MRREYALLVKRLKKLGVTPPPYPDYIRTARSVKDLLERLSKMKPPSVPDDFRIIGDWVTGVVLPDGKTIRVKGENLRIELKEEAET